MEPYYNSEKFAKFIKQELLQLGIKNFTEKRPKSVKKKNTIGLFNISLQNLDRVEVQLGNGRVVHIPEFVAEACKCILKDINTVGIFRLAGSEKRYKQMRTAFDVDWRSTLSANRYSVIEVACILKYFFRELPEPLVPKYIHEPLLESLNLAKDRSLAVMLICLLLPTVACNTLAYFLKFLLQVSERQSINKMPLENLVRILTPTLMPCNDNFNIIRFENHQKIIRVLIENCDNIGVLPSCLLEKMQIMHKIPLSFASMPALDGEFYGGVKKFTKPIKGENASSTTFLKVTDGERPSTSAMLSKGKSHAENASSYQRRKLCYEHLASAFELDHSSADNEAAVLANAEEPLRKENIRRSPIRIPMVPYRTMYEIATQKMAGNCYNSEIERNRENVDKRIALLLDSLRRDINPLSPKTAPPVPDKNAFVSPETMETEKLSASTDDTFVSAEQPSGLDDEKFVSAENLDIDHSGGPKEELILKEMHEVDINDNNSDEVDGKRLDGLPLRAIHIENGAKLVEAQVDEAKLDNLQVLCLSHRRSSLPELNPTAQEAESSGYKSDSGACELVEVKKTLRKKRGGKPKPSNNDVGDWMLPPELENNVNEVFIDGKLFAEIGGFKGNQIEDQKDCKKKGPCHTIADKTACWESAVEKSAAVTIQERPSIARIRNAGLVSKNKVYFNSLEAVYGSQLPIRPLKDMDMRMPRLSCSLPGQHNIVAPKAAKQPQVE